MTIGKKTSNRFAAAERQRRKEFLQAAEECYARLRKDPKAWQEELEERAVWETTLLDGLEEDEP